MDAEWCIVCDTKILASNETCASSAYCSSDCFIAAHNDATSRPSSSTISSPVSAVCPKPINGSSLPHKPPRKIASGFTFSGAGLGELSLNSTSESESERLVVTSPNMANSTFSRRQTRLKPVTHHQQNNLITPRLRLDALYPTHSVALNLEQLWTQQFLRASQPGSSPKSEEDLLNSGHPPFLPPRFNHLPPGLEALHQTAYVFPDDEVSEFDPDEHHNHHLDLGLNLDLRSYPTKSITTTTKTPRKKHDEACRCNGERGRSGKISSMASAVYT